MVPLDTVRTGGKLHTEESPSKPTDTELAPPVSLLEGKGTISSSFKPRACDWQLKALNDTVAFQNFREHFTSLIC